MLTHPNGVRDFIQLTGLIACQCVPVLRRGINRVAELNHSGEFSRRLIVTLGLALLLTVATAVTRAQTVTQDNFSADAAKAAATSANDVPAPESSSRPSALPAKKYQSDDRCDVKSFGVCVKDFFSDQKGIWTSPFRIRGKDAEWLLPFAGATAISLHYDAQAIGTLGPSASRDRISHRIADVGSPYTMAGIAAGAYLIGHFSHNETARETGVLSAEALVDTLVVTEVFKLATNRERPTDGFGTGRFWPDGIHNYPAGFSMPSGHATSAFAVARVIAEETPGHPYLHLGLYALAAGIGASRITGHNHFPSDVLVGSTFGYLIGGYVYRHHSAAQQGSVSSFTMNPIYDARTGTYGLSIRTNGEIFQGDRMRHFHFGAKRAANQWPISAGAN